MKKVLCLGFWCILLHIGGLTQVKVYVHLDTAVHKSLTGRLFLLTSTDTVRGVPNEPDVANPQPMYSMEVVDWQKDKAVVFDDAATSFSEKLSQLKPGTYSLAAIVDVNEEERGLFNPGNYYSRKNVLLHVSNGKGEAHIYLDKEARREFVENDSLKLLQFKSSLLSKFRNKDIFVKGAVILPSGYDAHAAHTYPVVYIIPGWGGTHYDAMGKNVRKRYGIGTGEPKIYVYLNPETQTPYGLHAFVDSRVNGPWGKALVEEVIPYIQKNYRATNDPQKTFVMGQSSGGYPALWLLLNYPKAFGGGWAVSPDPVDFSNFTGINLYASQANFYTNADGSEAPFYLVNGKFLSTNKKTIAIQDFFNNGGQMQSFEAEFGIPGKDGRPQQLFDHNTGLIHKEVVKEWQSYDLGMFIADHWKQLASDLSGKKIHVYAGADDNFLLNKSVEALKEKAGKAGADLVAEIIPNANHWTIWSDDFTRRIQKEMDERIDALK
jgi:S-formylglutathione hydrolase FrmB